MKSNAVIAREVVTQVLAKVRAANWDQYDASRRTGPVYEKTGVAAHRNALDVCLYVELRTEVGKQIYPDHRTAYAHWSRLAMSKGCGNCGEMAAAAFTLALEKGCPIVEYMTFVNVDHAFCVLGRPDTTSLAQPTSWGSDCWICDPWVAGIQNDVSLGAFSATRFMQVTARTIGNVDRSVQVEAREVAGTALSTRASMPLTARAR